jgi:hypothetical protein
MSKRSISVGSDPSRRTAPDRFGHLFEACGFTPKAGLLANVARLMNWADQAFDPSSDSSIPSGYTILGQFITHDLTFDTSPLDGEPEDLQSLENHRSPRFDLDSVYEKSPFLGIAPPRDLGTGEMCYRRSTQASEPDDLPRWIDLKGHKCYAGKTMPDGTPIPDEKAIIGDVRNDENLLIAQLHLAFLKLHNWFVQHIRARPSDSLPLDEGEVFEEARLYCRWYYQWVVVNDYLPRIVGQEMVDAVLKLNGALLPTFGLTKSASQPPEVDLKLYRDPAISPPTMPVEFSAAAFRFGHSMVRAQYRVNSGGSQVPLFSTSVGAEIHLGGSRRLPQALVVDWARFFDDLPAPPDEAGFARNYARKIDTRLNELLAALPVQSLPPDADPVERSLAMRDLQRGVDLGLPSGQDVAKEIARKVHGFTPLTDAELGLAQLRLDDGAPLWFYILKEAECAKNMDGVTGEQLGPVGGRIVAEVILGLLACDDSSYLYRKTDFTPAIEGGPIGKKFSMADLLRLAGVTPWGKARTA